MIAKLIYSSIFAKLNRGVEQLVARWAHNPKVAGSSPVPATREKRAYLLSFFMPKNHLVQHWSNKSTFSSTDIFKHFVDFNHFAYYCLTK